MRPTRLLVTLCFSFLIIFLTFYSLLASNAPPQHAGTSSASSADGRRGFRSLFSWDMPSTLFPQSAIISLTDDNSTFFLSRPASFGPRLPVEGLSGQIWIGGGFGDDVVLRGGGASTKSDGELGCSDIPGWDPNLGSPSTGLTDSSASKNSEKGSDEIGSAQQRQSGGQTSSNVKTSSDTKSGPRPEEDDGTDDHLHWPLKETALLHSSKSVKARKSRTEHADIQSLQESAEIAGKVVLLGRGGCGFLEKTKWVQRRGGLALIVGDNVRGGPLITMYANGDSSNITIPSLFTTRTTAHLLSSLLPPKSSEVGETSAKADQSTAKLSQEPSKAKTSPEKVQSPAPKTTPWPARVKRSSSSRDRIETSPVAVTPAKSRERGWFSWLSWRGNNANGLGGDSSRPPSSGQLSWVVSQDWDEDVGSARSKSRADKESKSNGKTRPDTKKAPGDSFVIGVQDWRDPDMMKPDTTKEDSPQNAMQQTKGSPEAKQKEQKNEKAVLGGSHTPGSGVYRQSEDKSSTAPDQSTKAEKSKQDSKNASPKDGWLGGLFGSSSTHELEVAGSSGEAKAAYEKSVASNYVKEKDFEEFAGTRPVEHEGLWVTMTPTTISATPFFDTLLVLVVSPLVTLTVVYALLLLRSRIRRRRWRAPKSVVDRLPVRTYHTISSYTSTSTSSQASSPDTSSPTSPLLRSGSRAIQTRARPRSRTTSVLAEEVSSSLDKATAKASISVGERKRLAPKKYSGRQVECVVCLEEYIDGQSRVMSLPCGHEFHAECMYVSLSLLFISLHVR